MDNLFKETALSKLTQATGWDKIFYGLLFVVSIFFVAGTLYTILTTIRLLATTNSLPSSLLLFTAVYVLIQTTLAYGFYATRLWITYALLSHTAIIIFTAFVLLPLFGLASLSHNTLLGAIPFAILGSLTFIKRSALQATTVVLPTLLYTLLICCSLVLNVIIYVYSPN
jgi:hypothetical protein